MYLLSDAGGIGVLRYHKGAPGEYTLKYVHGRVVKEGRGLSLLHSPIRSTVMSVPMAPTRRTFRFVETTADMHDVTLSGDVMFSISNPRRAGLAFGFGHDERNTLPSIDEAGRCVESVLRDIARDEIYRVSAEEAIKAKPTLGRTLLVRSKHSHALRRYGLQVLNVFVHGLEAPSEAVNALRRERAMHAVVRQPDICPGPNAPPAFRPALAGPMPSAEPEDHGESMECSDACPFRFVCEDYMRDIRDGRAVCTLFREFDT